jgi:hypothetical protein
VGRLRGAFVANRGRPRKRRLCSFRQCHGLVPVAPTRVGFDDRTAAIRCSSAPGSLTTPEKSFEAEATQRPGPSRPDAMGAFIGRGQPPGIALFTMAACPAQQQSSTGPLSGQWMGGGPSAAVQLRHQAQPELIELCDPW